MGMNRDEYIPSRPPILDREPGPYAFTRSPSEIAADDWNLAIDLDNEHYDNTIWDRD